MKTRAEMLSEIRRIGYRPGGLRDPMLCQWAMAISWCLQTDGRSDPEAWELLEAGMSGKPLPPPIPEKATS